MSFRFQSQLFVDNLPDEAISTGWEVVMPTLPLNPVTNNSSKKKGNLLTRAISKVGSALGLQTYTPIVEEVSFGVRNFTTTTRRIRTGWLNVPEDVENYRDVALTFFCSSGMLTQYYLESWKKLIFNEDGEYYNSIRDYKKNIEVFFFGPGNLGAGMTPAAHISLLGCFPYSQESYRLSYDRDPERIRIKQNFKVDKVVVDTALANKAIAAETISSPTSLLDKALTGLNNKFGDKSEYKLSDVYE